MRWHTFEMAAIAPTARTFELVATIADRLALEFDDTVAAMDAAVIEAVPAFGADAAIAAALTANNRGNLQRFLAVARLRRSMAPAPSRAAASTWTRSMRGIDAANRSHFSAGWPVRTKSSSPARI